MIRHAPSGFAMWISTMLFLLSALLQPVGASVNPPASAQSPSPIAVPNPGTDLWRAVRQRDMHVDSRTQVQGVETGVLITKSGEDFRQFRMTDFVGISGWVVLGAAALILLFYLLRGQIPIDGGRSDKVIKRFEEFDRVVHWFTAVLFIFLALTGLTLLFGRFVIMPVIGAEAFGIVASAAKEGHNLFGPLFLIAVALLFIRFVARNMPARGDLKWLLTGGGIIGKGHVSAGYFNAGEKIWFWLAIVLGLVVSVSGVILVFPIIGLDREIMQLALIVHGIAAILFIAGSFGHIYIGTIGSEGSFDGMATGYVDSNWAKTHHDRWYDEIKDEAVSVDSSIAKHAVTERMQASTDKA